MKEKLTLRICTGTACYVQGGSYLFDIEDRLTENEKSQIEITGSSCLGFCSRKEHGIPPFIELNGRCIGDVTLSSLIDEIRKILYGGKL